jgi:hypothetical protein
MSLMWWTDHIDVSDVMRPYTGVDGLDGTPGDGIDVAAIDDDDAELGSDAAAVSTAAIKALAAMAEGTGDEAAEMQRAMVFTPAQ